MKRQFKLAGVAIAVAAALAACNKSDEAKAPKLETEDAKAAYSIGYMTGKSLEGQIPKLDLDNYAAGLRDAYAKKPGALNAEQMKATLMAFEVRMKAEAEERMKKASSENVAKGEKFLAENAKKAGVKTTASGLQYEVLTEGKGPKPLATDQVKVHYEGKLLDGTVFDSSVARGEPIEFGLNQVIKGWTEGVQLMVEGEKTRFYIPANLAYGDRAAGKIPPGSVLIFDVELLGIQ